MDEKNIQNFVLCNKFNFLKNIKNNKENRENKQKDKSKEEK